MAKQNKSSVFVAVTLAMFTGQLLYGLAVLILPQYARSNGISQASLGLLVGSYSAASLFVSRCRFEANWAEDYGGAINTLLNSRVVVEDSVFDGAGAEEKTGVGGCLHSQDTTWALYRSTLRDCVSNTKVLAWPQH